MAVPDAPLEYEPTMPAEALASPGLSLKQVFSMLWAHRMLSAAIMVAIVVPTGLFAKFLLPKTYLATATLVVNYSVNDPLAANNTNAALMANYMSTRIQLMQSSEVLMPVIDKLDLTKDKEYVAGFSGDPNALRDYVKEGLSRNLDIEQGAFGSQLLNVTASARDPIKAAKIANTLSEIYAAQELARQTGPATERALRYAEQLAELKNKVNLAQEQVTAFRQRTGVTTDLAAQNNTEAELLTTLEQRLQEAQTQRRSAEVKAVTDQNGGSSFTTSVVVQGLRTQIATLESQLAQYSSTLGTQNPKVIQLQLQLAATRKSLANELQTYSSSASSDLNASRQLEAKLQGAVDQQRAKVLTVRRQQEEGTKYVLELESAHRVQTRPGWIRRNHVCVGRP